MERTKGGEPNEGERTEEGGLDEKGKARLTSGHSIQKMKTYSCDSCRIQTCNLLIRSQMLYSVELRSHAVSRCLSLKSDCKDTNFFVMSKIFFYFFYPYLCNALFFYVLQTEIFLSIRT